jgi:hypothetical protein
VDFERRDKKLIPGFGAKIFRRIKYGQKNMSSKPSNMSGVKHGNAKEI